MGTKTKRNRKKLLLLLIPVVIIILGILAFQLRDGNVTMKISLGNGFTKLFEVDAEDLTLTYSDSNKSSKAKFSSNNEITVKQSDVGYGISRLLIPATIKSSNKTAKIAVNYMKSNDWYRSKIKMTIDAVKKGNIAKVTLDVDLDEKGLGNKDEWQQKNLQEKLKVDLNKNGNYETGFGL